MADKVTSIAGDATKGGREGGPLPNVGDAANSLTTSNLAGKSQAEQDTIIQRGIQDAENRGRERANDKNSLKINISLDLDVEVHLTARIKGDIAIGLL